MVLIVGQNSVWQNTYNLPSLTTGSVNRVTDVFASAAGKGSNVARALAFLGEESLLLAYVGGPNGEKFRAACHSDGIRTEFTDIARETRICTTLIEESGEITEVVEPAPPVSPEEVASFRDSFDRNLTAADLLVVSGTAMTGEPESSYLGLITAAHSAGVPTLLDSYRKHGRRALEAAPEVLKINVDELSELSGLDCSTAGARASAAGRIQARFGIRWIIITRGEEGAEGFEGGPLLQAISPSVKLVNAIGSGDSFTAGVAHTLLEARRRSSGRGADPFPWGATLADALRTGTAMGSANCLNIKPAHIEPEDYRRIYASVEIGETVL